MFEMDKQKFGTFVSALRKEKGLTQKELAAQLYISDKAISKWETGVSIPDTALLIPLSEALGVTVTELLKCQRLTQEVPMDTTQVESIVRTAISYSEENGENLRQLRTKGLFLYILCLAVCATELAVSFHLGCTHFSVNEPLMVMVLLCAIFGLYFMAFAIQKLPAYYDENRIQSFSDGPMRLNLPGIRISNRNWPHIVTVGRFWSMGMLVLYPLLNILMQTWFSPFWAVYERLVFLVLMLGGLFIPMVIVGKKFQ